MGFCLICNFSHLIPLESFLFKSMNSLIELESSLFEYVSSLIGEFFNAIRELQREIRVLSNYTYIENSLFEYVSSLIELKSSLIE